jgi:uncharacterized protein YbjT (DUF2867 family)
MNVLLTGPDGFIGKHLAQSLRDAGHVVIAARRGARDGSTDLAVDFARDLSVRDWLPRLAGVDAVINAVGIIREHGAQSFECVHKRAPQALFAACVAAGVRRVVQISALGADRGRSRYFLSKRAADDYLATLPLDWTIVRPALVYGTGGASARLFTMLASMPLVPLPGRGHQCVQPIHIDDLTTAIVRLLSDPRCHRERIELVGPQPLTFRELLAELRAALYLGPPRFLPVPLPVMRASAHIAALSPRSSLDPETLTMLEAGNTGDPSATLRLLGRPPRPVANFIDLQSRAAALIAARLMWLLPLLRISIALMWIWTAIVSLWLYPREASHELLARTGIGPSLAPLFLYAAAVLDLLFGFATLLLRDRRLLWLAQMVVIVGYTVIISWRLPEFWLHPYGPILKNLPILAAIYTLYAVESRE